MKRNTLLASALVSALLLPTGFAMAAEQTSTKENVQEQLQEKGQVYGSQLMTQEERAEHRAKLDAAKNDKEREKIRKENHKKMEIRAKERGVTLPDETRARKNGENRDSGERMGPKNGKNSGGGQNR